MENPLLTILAPVVLGAGAIIWLMPSKRGKPRAVAGVLGLLAIFMLSRLTQGSGQPEHDVLFHVFSAVALVSGGLMITDKKPAYAALWFALVTLAVCGLFFLQSAPFLAAASVIVYAGAIIVTFMFVLMLASQSGAAGYDQRPQHPLLATTIGFLFLTCLLVGLKGWGPDTLKTDGESQSVVTAQAQSLSNNPLSEVSGAPASASGRVEIGTLHQLGRSLFGDYLYAVEMAGTLLLVAAIGAIAIAPRRSQGTL